MINYDRVDNGNNDDTIFSILGASLLSDLSTKTAQIIIKYIRINNGSSKLVEKL